MRVGVNVDWGREDVYLFTGIYLLSLPLLHWFV